MTYDVADQMTGRLLWLALLVVAGGCGKKSDAQRAADERAAARKAGMSRCCWSSTGA